MPFSKKWRCSNMSIIYPVRFQWNVILKMKAKYTEIFSFLKQYKALRIWNYRRSEILWCLLRSFLCALMRCQRRSFKCNLMMEYHNPLNLVERLFHQNAVDITMQNCKVKAFWFKQNELDQTNNMLGFVILNLLCGLS